MKKHILIVLASLLFASTARAGKSLVSEKFEADMAKAVAENLSTIKSIDEVWDPKEKNLPANQYYIKNMTLALKDKKPAKIYFDGKKSVIIEENGKKIEVEFVSVLQKKFRINGYAVDLRNYKTLQERHNFIERILQSYPPKSALFEIVLGKPAYAAGPVAWGIVVLANAAGWGSVGYQNLKNNKKEMENAFAGAFLAVEDEMVQGAKIVDLECARTEIILRTDNPKYPELKFDKIKYYKNIQGKDDFYQTIVANCACTKECKGRLVKAVNENATSNSQPRKWDKDGNPVQGGR